MTSLNQCRSQWPGCGRDDCGWPDQPCAAGGEPAVLAASSEGVYEPNPHLPSERFCAKYGHLWRWPSRLYPGPKVCVRCGTTEDDDD